MKSTISGLLRLGLLGLRIANVERISKRFAGVPNDDPAPKLKNQDCFGGLGRAPALGKFCAFTSTDLSESRQPLRIKLSRREVVDRQRKPINVGDHRPEPGAVEDNGNMSGKATRTETPERAPAEPSPKAPEPETRASVASADQKSRLAWLEAYCPLAFNSDIHSLNMDINRIVMTKTTSPKWSRIH